MVGPDVASLGGSTWNGKSMREDTGLALLTRSTTRPHGGGALQVSLSSVINLGLFTIGLILNLWTFNSVGPLLASILFFGFGIIAVKLSSSGNTWSVRMFIRVFLIGWTSMGLSQLYIVLFNDNFQILSDPGNFFEIASEASNSLSLQEIRQVTEGSLAIVLWRAIYDLFAGFGFPRDRYIGVLVNVTAVAFSGVAIIQMAKLIYGVDVPRFRRLILMISCCGLMWLFAGIHLRDGIVLLTVTLLTWLWVWYLQRPLAGVRLCALLVFSILGGTILGLLREEFFFVPLGLAIFGVTALLFGRDRNGAQLSRIILVAIGIGLISVLGFLIFDNFIETLTRGWEGYLNFAREEHGSSSLGLLLIVNQPLPIRLILGFFYLFAYPIPFWSGFQLSSAYDLFKSFNVLFFYAIIPLLVLSVFLLLRQRELRSPSQLFLLFSVLGFSGAIAVTSLETRHFGAFLSPIFLLGLLPDLTIPRLRASYRSVLVLVLLSVIAVHVFWVAMKIG